MHVTIRETTLPDFEGVSDLLHQVNLRRTYFTKEKFEAMLTKNRRCCYVAKIDGKLVGTVSAMHDGAFRGYIHKLAVAPEYQRQGIASGLVKKVLKQFDQVGIPRSFVHIERINGPSRKLFTSLGFEERDSHLIVDRTYQKENVFKIKKAKREK